MSRFVAPQLESLGDVPLVVPVVFEDIKSGRDAYLVAALARLGIDYDVTALETDPLVVAYSEGGGYQERNFRQRVNESIRGLSLAMARTGDLDHIGATYAGIGRLVYDNDADDQPANSQWDAVRGKWVETDRNFRARIKLAFEAFSTAGPEGAYVFHALELDGIRDVADAAAYSEEDDAVYSATLHADAHSMGLIAAPFVGRTEGAPVMAPEILIVVLPTRAYGEADQALLNRVFSAVTSEDVRPLGDNVRVEAAEVTNYNIEVNLYYAPGADTATIKTAAEARLAAYAADRRRVGFSIQREVIGGRAAPDNAVTVEVVAPAYDIEPGSKGAAQVGVVTVNAIQTPGAWE